MPRSWPSRPTLARTIRSGQEVVILTSLSAPTRLVRIGSHGCSVSRLSGRHKELVLRHRSGCRSTSREQVPDTRLADRSRSAHPDSREFHFENWLIGAILIQIYVNISCIGEDG